MREVDLATVQGLTHVIPLNAYDTTSEERVYVTHNMLHGRSLMSGSIVKLVDKQYGKTDYASYCSLHMRIRCSS